MSRVLSRFRGPQPPARTRRHRPTGRPRRGGASIFAAEHLDTVASRAAQYEYSFGFRWGILTLESGCSPCITLLAWSKTAMIGQTMADRRLDKVWGF